MFNSTEFDIRLHELYASRNNYFAHIREGSNETLLQHSELVNKYFLKLIETHKIDPVINILIGNLIDSYTDQNKKIISNFIRSVFFAIPQYHDFGKLNPNFQAVKMSNPEFNNKKNSLGSDHSKIGGFSLIHSFLKEANKPAFSPIEKLMNLYILFVFHYSIKQHHAPSLEYNNEYYFEEEFIQDLFNEINSSGIFSFSKEITLQIGDKFNQDILPKTQNKSKDSFPLFALLKLNYSLLTASDYLATTHFMNNWGNELMSDFGIFDETLKKKIISKAETSTSYNRKTYKELENYKLEFPMEKSNDNLNKLRQNLSVEIITGIRNNLNKNLFYIEAPTGGGKTNLSMLALAEFLRNDIDTGENNITKVFYVFPFTTLITQTFKSLKETLALKDEEIVQIHSKAGFSQKGTDDKYGKDKLNIIDYQFVNYPVALLSHIKFFDILKSNRKAANYLMHRLANSIVIIDELQTYSPSEWDKVIYFINKYAKYFNIKFILMSATLPKIDILLSEEGKKEGFEKEEFINLNQNKDLYFQNPNFAQRIEFDFSMINNQDFDKKDKDGFLQKIWTKLVEESEKYKEQSEEKRVHTIIEFIFKKTATKFIELANENNTLFDEIFILSGTILEPRRKEIINKLKSDDYQRRNILLITTQVVEAGVDIDMDLGFKDTSLIDSDEQLAGRINRNVSKPRCKLFLFNYDDAKTIYGKDYRYKEIKEKLTPEDYKEILQKKDFDRLYNFVMNHIRDFNEQEAYTDTLPEYLKSIKNLDFETVNRDFQLISNAIQTTPIFIPVNIPVQIPASTEKNFLDEELNFLKEKEKYNDEEFVSGEKVWELYCEIIENKDDDFTRQKSQKIIMQGLVSKFSISVSTFSKEMKNIESAGYGVVQYGFYKLFEPNKVYDYENGIKSIEFEDINFL